MRKINLSNDTKRDAEVAYESQINFYLNGQPNNLMGMLTFYNAIANGGKMVKICEPEEEGVTVIHEQICYPEYIKSVQRAMERCVSDGIYKKARHEYIDVAVCGRTLRFEDFPPSATLQVLAPSSSEELHSLLKYV